MVSKAQLELMAQLEPRVRKAQMVLMATMATLAIRVLWEHKGKMAQLGNKGNKALKV